MKTKLLTSLFFLFIFNIITAQEKKAVGILKVKDKSGQEVAVSTAITETLTSAFVNAKRFIIVERTKMDQISNEKELQKSEDFIDGTIIEKTKNIGAEYVVSTVLNTYSNDGFTCKFSFNVSLIDVTTGQVISSKLIESKGGSSAGKVFGGMGSVLMGDNLANPNKEEALKKSLRNIDKDVLNFINDNFPILFEFVDVQQKDNKGNAVKVLVAGGSGFGIKKGDKLKIVEETEVEVAGKKMIRKKDLGEVYVLNVEDENFSICQVKTGGNEINSRFEAKAKLKVMQKTE